MDKKKIKIEIKNRWTGKVLFEYEKEDNTMKETVIEAVKRGADLRGADLGGAENVPYIPMACPSDGAFIGWKKIKYQQKEYLVKMFILEDSKRSSATGRKCRCDKAKVLAIYESCDLKKEVKEVVNSNYVTTVYRAGDMVFADKWDDERFNECSHGIHFFINKQEAIDYNL